MQLEQKLNNFFKKHINDARPVLLALSGGADSSCLFDLLLCHKKKYPFELIVVCIDHGWRKESAFECEQVKKHAESLGLTCYTKRLDPTRYTENLELAARCERMQFFQEVAQKTNAQGIFLAHHADDLSETFFKRMLEGASLFSLYGMTELTHFDNLALFRPLLAVRKRQIVDYLSAKNIAYFDDPTNLDPKFLRGACRTKIFPFLKEAFGKSFEENFCKLASDSYELHTFLDEQTKDCVQNALLGPFGSLYEEFPKHPFLLKYMVKKIAKMHGLVLSRDQHASICQQLIENKANKRTLCGNTTLLCDRGRLFVLSTLPRRALTQKLKIGTQYFGPWQFTVQEYAVQEHKGEPYFFNHWKHFFFGESLTCLPKADYSISPIEPQMRRIFFHKNKQKTTKIITNFLNERKTPHFLATSVPVLIQDGYIVEDFLTGCRQHVALADSMLLIKMTYTG